MKFKVNNTARHKCNPWQWIPLLYIAEGLPYFAVNTLTTLMYFNMGVSIEKITYFTGWLYFPWVIKPFWSPFIDLFGSKRGWTIAMQIIIAFTMAAVAFLLPFSFFFSATLAAFWLMAFASATHDIAADGYYMLALTSHEQAAYVGVRSTFYRLASILGQGGLVILAGYLETRIGIKPAWQWIFILLSGIFILIAFYNIYMMPKSSADHAVEGVSSKTILRDFGNTFVTFFQKPHVITAILFMLLYRLPEAFCIKMIQPFMLSPFEEGGLGLTTAQVGFVNGTVGVIALLAGGITGGLAISAWGLKKCLWPMASALTLPCLLYCWLALVQPHSIALISVAVGIEQFGYGYGFTAFMLYLIYFSKGSCSTSHYAFCTAFMALGMMIPGMFAGDIFNFLDNISIFTTGTQHNGFINFFTFVMLCCTVTFAVCSLLKIDAGFGRKTKVETE